MSVSKFVQLQHDTQMVQQWTKNMPTLITFIDTLILGNMTFESPA
jgi:hypothetical protein